MGLTGEKSPMGENSTSEKHYHETVWKKLGRASRLLNYHNKYAFMMAGNRQLILNRPRYWYKTVFICDQEGGR